MLSLCVCMFIVSTATIAIGSGWTLFVYCDDEILLVLMIDFLDFCVILFI